MTVHRRGRLDNLRRIASLDPDADREEITALTSTEEFPWEWNTGTAVAFLRDYGVPSISRLLDTTGEFREHGQKRYDDTILFAVEGNAEGLDSRRGHAAIRRLNRIHGHYDIAAHELRFVLATTLVGPRRFIDAHGWRALHPHEVAR